MNQDFQEQDAIRYFFGELSEAELTAFEDKFFADAEFSDRLEESETDLIDDYLRGELSATEQMKFEEKYLVSEHRRERVQAATAIWENEKAQATVAVVETSKVTFWESIKSFFTVPQLTFVAPIILLLVLLGGLFFFLRQPSSDMVEKGNENINILPTPTLFPSISPDISPTPTISPTADKIPAKTATPKVNPTPSPTAKETPKPIEPPQPVTASITLFPTNRSDGITNIILKKGTKTLFLSLNRDIKDEVEKYQIEVSNPAVICF